MRLIMRCKLSGMHAPQERRTVSIVRLLGCHGIPQRFCYDGILWPIDERFRQKFSAHLLLKLVALLPKSSSSVRCIVHMVHMTNTEVKRRKDSYNFYNIFCRKNQA